MTESMTLYTVEREVSNVYTIIYAVSRGVREVHNQSPLLGTFLGTAPKGLTVNVEKGGDTK